MSEYHGNENDLGMTQEAYDLKAGPDGPDYVVEDGSRSKEVSKMTN